MKSSGDSLPDGCNIKLALQMLSAGSEGVGTYRLMEVEESVSRSTSTNKRIESLLRHCMTGEGVGD